MKKLIIIGLLSLACGRENVRIIEEEQPPPVPITDEALCSSFCPGAEKIVIDHNPTGCECYCPNGIEIAANITAGEELSRMWRESCR